MILQICNFYARDRLEGSPRGWARILGNPKARKSPKVDPKRSTKILTRFGETRVSNLAKNPLLSGLKLANIYFS